MSVDIGTTDTTERLRLGCGFVERRKQRAVLREIIVKTQRDELKNWKKESSLSSCYVTVWKGVKIRLHASEPIGDIETHFYLSAGCLEWEPLFPIFGQISTRKLSALEESPLASSPEYFISKEGHYGLLRRLYSLVEDKVESIKWMHSNSLEFTEEVLGISVKNLSANEIQEKIITVLLRRVSGMEWKIDCERPGHPIYRSYIVSLQGINTRIRKEVLDWFFLTIKKPGSKKSVLIHGREKKGYREIPGQETRFYSALENLYGQVDRKCQELACAKQKAKIRKKSTRFLSLLRSK